MSNPLTAGQTPQAKMPDINALFQQFKQNPVEFLIRSKLNIPQGMSDPQQIFNHLTATGQVPKQLMPQIQQMIPKR